MHNAPREETAKRAVLAWFEARFCTGLSTTCTASDIGAHGGIERVVQLGSGNMA